MSDPRPGLRQRLVNGSTGDPVLFLDPPRRGDALLFDCGDVAGLTMKELADLAALFVSHHHIDHVAGLDRVVRGNIDCDKTLHLVGPEGTIRRVFDRVRSYEHPFYPFQKLVIACREIHPDRVVSAAIDFARRLPEPEPVAADRSGPVVFERAGWTVEAAFADHTAPCLAFAAVDPGGGRVAYVTDTAWSESARPGLLALARGARRLYCDSYYAEAQADRAEAYRHMTAARAAAFAREAGVAELVLIHFAPRYAGRYAELIDEARAVFPATVAEVGPEPERPCGG